MFINNKLVFNGQIFFFHASIINWHVSGNRTYKQ